ncbi:hypothetical protein [Candidatus Symbiopectobacterium sp.]|nr:hypothetical protein [Candidatus Symbiopectobacterium sp.]
MVICSDDYPKDLFIQQSPQLRQMWRMRRNYVNPARKTLRPS